MNIERCEYYHKLVGSWRAVKQKYSVKENDSLWYESFNVIRVVVEVLIARRTTAFRLCAGGLYYFPDEYVLNWDPDREYKLSDWAKIEALSVYIGPGVTVLQKDNTVCIRKSGKHFSDMDQCRAASAFPMMFPALFKDEPLTDDERQFLKLLSTEDKLKDAQISEFNELCKRFYERLGIEEWKLREQVHILTSGRMESAIKQTQNKIKENEDLVQEYESRINNLIESIRDLELKLFALQQKTQGEQENELLDFVRHSDISLDLNSSDSLLVTVKTMFGCYDEGEVEKYVINNRSVLKGMADGWYVKSKPLNYSENEMKRFYKAVFSNRFEIKVAATYIVRNTLSVIANSTERTIDVDYINNPNIGRAGCLGGYRTDLNEAQRSGDPIAILSICQQSAASINLGEIWPMAVVTCELNESKGKVIRTENGDITFQEAMEILKKEEEDK